MIPELVITISGIRTAMPGVMVVIGVTLFSGVWRVWFEAAPTKTQGKGGLPPWPVAASDKNPALVVGETHHPVEAREVPNPEWLVIPERGLYTGIAIFGAVGSGMTSACMHPFARQLLGWQATNPERRAAALILEVKGDFCYDIREILKKAGREDDYMELGMGGKWQWNPLAAHRMCCNFQTSSRRWPGSSRAGPSPNPHNRPRYPCSLERPVEPGTQ